MCNDESSCKVLGRLKLLWENYEEEIIVANPGNNANIRLNFSAFVCLLPPTCSLTLTVFYIIKEIYLHEIRLSLLGKNYHKFWASKCINHSIILKLIKWSSAERIWLPLLIIFLTINLKPANRCFVFHYFMW